MDVLTTMWEFLNQDNPKGSSTPPTDSDYRITDDGSFRITNTGDKRIVVTS